LGDVANDADRAAQFPFNDDRLGVDENVTPRRADLHPDVADTLACREHFQMDALLHADIGRRRLIDHVFFFESRQSGIRRVD